MDKELFDLNIIEKSRQKEKRLQEIQEQALKQHLKEQASADFREKLYAREKRQDLRIKAPSVLREALLSAFMDKLYTVTLEHLNINDENGIRYSMINNYIQENGANNIVKNFSKNSEYLSEVAFQINKTVSSILEACDKGECNEIINIKVDEENKNKFLDSVDFGTIDQIADKIADRVQQAQAEFIDLNEKDSQHIEAIIAATQEKIDGTVKESLINLYENDCKYAINKVKKRDKSIYEVMVNKICESTYKNDLIKEQFLTEDSKLDLPSIIETATIMYTFLEMTNTAKFDNVDKSYIETVYNELTH
jgi:hypothetical protein